MIPKTSGIKQTDKSFLVIHCGLKRFEKYVTEYCDTRQLLSGENDTARVWHVADPLDLPWVVGHNIKRNKGVGEERAFVVGHGGRCPLLILMSVCWNLFQDQ